MYLMNQMALFLLAAGVIGFLAGWFFGRCTCDKEGLIKERDAALAEAERARAAAGGAGLAAPFVPIDRPTPSETFAELQAPPQPTPLPPVTPEAAAAIAASLARGDAAAAQPPLSAAPSARHETRDVGTGFTPSPLALLSPTALEAAVLAAGDGAAPKGLAEPQGDPDDLTRINGVGPMIATWLNEQGLHHYWQIASLTAAETAWLARHMPNFGSRIYRENWIEQAARLAVP